MYTLVNLHATFVLRLFDRVSPRSAPWSMKISDIDKRWERLARWSVVWGGGWPGLADMAEDSVWFAHCWISVPTWCWLPESCCTLRFCTREENLPAQFATDETEHQGNLVRPSDDIYSRCHNITDLNVLRIECMILLLDWLATDVRKICL